MGLIKGIGPRCRKQVTGQLVQYSGMDDDGFFERGYVRRYVALSTGNYAGTTNITVNGKTIAMENACVLDKNSGLMWMRYTPDSDIGPDNNGRLYWIDAINNEDIFTFCDAANIAELAGHDDWRVPNLFELYSIVVLDAGIGAPYINTTYFQCHFYWYWTSTTTPSTVANAIPIHFQHGYAGSNPKIAGKYYLRLVRRG